MTQFPVRQWFWLLFLFFILNACTTVVVKDKDQDKDQDPRNQSAYQERIRKLNATSEWGLVGKISLDDADQGGSGRLQWDVKPGHAELDFHGAMGRGAWHLDIGTEHALLKMADGTEQTAASVNELVQDNMGWPVPLEALQWWVRGLAAPGVIEDEQFGADGLLVSLRQFGWSVDFRRYDSVENMKLPIRLNATRDNYRVKLAISRWRMDVGDAHAN